MKKQADREARRQGLLPGLDKVDKIEMGSLADTDSCNFSIGNSSLDTSIDTDFEELPEEVRADIGQKIADDVLQALKDSALELPKNHEAVEDVSLTSRTRSIKVPPGKLGIIVDMDSSDGPVVQDVDQYSPVKGRIYPGDRIVAIDGVEIEGKPREEIAVVMASGMDKSREFTVESA